MYRYLVIGRDKSYFVKSLSKSNNKYKQDEINQILDFLINNQICPVWQTVFQQMIRIPIGTNCAPLLVNLFHHAYKADFLQGLLKYKDRRYVTEQS